MKEEKPRAGFYEEKQARLPGRCYLEYKNRDRKYVGWEGSWMSSSGVRNFIIFLIHTPKYASTYFLFYFIFKQGGERERETWTWKRNIDLLPPYAS